MSEERRGLVPLLVIAGLFALATGSLMMLGVRSGPGAQPGQIAPDFELPRLDGAPVALSQQRGRVVFVNFWATWCPPCRKEAPSLERLYERLREDGFEVLAVSIDALGQEAAVEAFRREFGLRFPILLDPSQDAHRSFGVTGVPETYLIDAQGRLAERFIGPRDWDDPRYTRVVERLLERDAGPRELRDG